MAGDQVNFTSLRIRLRFTLSDETPIKTHMQNLISADSIWVARSGENYPGPAVPPRITISYNPSFPPFSGAAGTVATDEIVTSYIHTLANIYAVVRTFRFTRYPDGQPTLVKAYHANPTDADEITNDQIKDFIKFVPTPNIADSNFTYGSGTPWQAMITYFSNRESGVFSYCHGNFPPPCHGSRGRR